MCFHIVVSVRMLSHLVLAGVPVVQQASRDEEGVVLMAALAVVPATVVADLCLPSGQTDWTLTTWGESHWVNVYVSPHLNDTLKVLGFGCL